MTVLLARSLKLGLTASLGLLTAAFATTERFDDLAPISEGPELRIRVNEFVILSPAYAHAYVVRPGVIIAYYTYDGAHWTSRTVTTAAADEVLSIAAELPNLDGRRFMCAYDGNLVEMVGVIDRRRFSLVASQPEYCTDPASRPIGAALELAMRATQ